MRSQKWFHAWLIKYKKKLLYKSGEHIWSLECCLFISILYVFSYFFKKMFNSTEIIEIHNQCNIRIMLINMQYSNRQICPALLYDIFLYLINHAWNLFCDLIRQEKMAFHFWQHNDEKYNMYITPAVVVYDIFYNKSKSVFLHRFGWKRHFYLVFGETA